MKETRRDLKGIERNGREQKLMREGWIGNVRTGQDRKWRDGKWRSGKERKGKERKGKERKGKERKGKDETGQDMKEKRNRTRHRNRQNRTRQERKGMERKGKDRTGKDRTGKDRTFRKGQDRKGKDRNIKPSDTCQLSLISISLNEFRIRIRSLSLVVKNYLQYFWLQCRCLSDPSLFSFLPLLLDPSPSCSSAQHQLSQQQQYPGEVGASESRCPLQSQHHQGRLV